MKSKKRKVLETTLRWMAQAVLRKYRPVVVGITGSVGKSSTKEAIALVLAAKFSVRKSEENYNNEIGAPLTILGVKSGKRSVTKWFGILWKWIMLMVFPAKYPEVLVLELGIDRKGDMKYLMDFLPVHVGVLTDISLSHLEYFKTPEHIAREKGLLIRRLPKDGTAILCADNALVMKFRDKTKAKVLSYGFAEGADISAEHVSFHEGGVSGGCHFKVAHNGKTLPIRLPHIIASHHVPAVLAAIAVGISFKMNLVEIAAAASEFRPLPGRMTRVSGLRHSTLIDDTYNASPLSTGAALETLRSLSGSRKIAVLGDMLELGDQEERSHVDMAKKIQAYGIDVAYLVGRRMLKAYEALGSGVSERRWFEDPLSAAAALREAVQEGDVILVKGSQGMRMEKVSEALLAHQEDAPKLLCRQSEDWKKKPFVQP